MARTLVSSPRKRGPAKVVLSTYIPPEVSDALREVTANEGVTVAAFVTEALIQYLCNPGRRPVPATEPEQPPGFTRSGVARLLGGEPVPTPLLVTEPPGPPAPPAEPLEPPAHRPSLVEQVHAPSPPAEPPKPVRSIAERFRLGE